MTAINEYLEIFFIAAGLILMSARRFISGCKNAAFYAKRKYVGDVPGYIFRWVQNLHALESPAWYAQFGAVFCFVVTIAMMRGHAVPMSCAYAMLLTMSSSAIAGPFFQGVINEAVGRPFIDNDENPESEFVLGKISFWWWRPWRGFVRVVGAATGVIGLAAGIWLIFFG